MARIATGAVTLTDITDGVSAIKALLTVPNHSFVSQPDGEVLAIHHSESVWKTSLNVFVSKKGIAPITATRVNGTAAPVANDTFTIRSVTATNGWTTNTDFGTDGDVFIASTGDIDERASVITIAITVRVDGISHNISLLATVSKAVEGVGGSAINMQATRNSFSFNSNSPEVESKDSAITITYSTLGFTTIPTIQKSVNSSAFSTLVNGTGVDQAVINTTAKTIVVSGANFDDSETFTVKLSNGNVSREVSIHRIQPGTSGASNILVDLTVSSSSGNGKVFRATDTNDKTITATVVDSKTGTIITHVGTGAGQLQIAYNWSQQSDVGVTTDVQVATNSARNVVLSGGVTADGNGKNTIIVGDEDIPDTKSVQYSCQVTATQH